MEYEHFGIAVVELMSSGIVTIAHNSAGPKLDIIGGSKEQVGYLANSLESYKELAVKAFSEYESDHYIQLRKRARKWVSQRFGVQAFEDLFVSHISTLM